MESVQSSCLKLWALGAALLASPVALHADVMEVGGDGYSWVSGGPAVLSMQTPIVATPSAQVARALTPSAAPAGPAQWQGHVTTLAARYDLSPALIEALVWQESRWNPGATSPKGAHGLAQLMPGTAHQLGVDPRDPAANLEGGARYLRQQLDTFGGDVERALAAYNAGPKRVLAAGGVPRIAETRAYVAAILARLADPVRR
jgi:soluble lytic murein transglycosylase-like protein